MNIKLKRVYDKPTRTDGTRILVDRLWPRGIKKTDLALDAWLKELAPSSELRKWFSHDPAKWHEFQKKYAKELDKNQKALVALVQAIRKGQVTLLYSSNDTEHNNAICLKEYLERNFT